MKKNDVIRLTLTGLTSEGSGIGRYEGIAVFVPMTAPGETVSVRILKVKKSYAYGKVEEIIAPAGCRITPDCDVFGKCGGCVYRHVDYGAECAAKQQRVEDAIRRIGGIDLSPCPILPAVQTDRYRNKAEYPVAPDGSVGFFAVHSHRIVPCGDCRLQPEVFSTAAAVFTSWLRESGASVYSEETRRGLIRHLYLRLGFATNEIMVTVVVNGKSVPQSELLIARLLEALGDDLKSIQLNVNRDDTNVILGRECRVLYGSPYITDVLCGVRVRLSPLSFYQVNRDMAEMLYRKAAEYARPQGRTLLDLYCGAGTIGLSMAQEAESVIGVEIVPEAIADAKINAKENGIENARFLCADAKDAAVQLSAEGLHPDVVIVDPPRKGCSAEVLHTVAEDFRPERIVYVSCDPATLARDAAILTELGYELKEYTPVDLFPRTSHVETVCLLTREN